VKAPAPHSLAAPSAERLPRRARPACRGAGLEPAFDRVLRRLRLVRMMPDFHVEFCAFAGLRSTIRLRQNSVHARISDLLAGAPPLVLEALAEILLAQLFRGRASREARECYLAYVLSPAVRRRIEAARRRRGYKRLLAPQGKRFHLGEIFAGLNRRYFAGRLPAPRLGWTLKRSRSILGHYDAAHRTISISRRLDAPSVPRYLVEYLVFHEMLHMRYPVSRRGHRRVIHPPEFLAAEKGFAKYEQARKKLRDFCV
jgi:hypothetical protein